MSIELEPHRVLGVILGIVAFVIWNYLSRGASGSRVNQFGHTHPKKTNSEVRNPPLSEAEARALAQDLKSAFLSKRQHATREIFASNHFSVILDCRDVFAEEQLRSLALFKLVEAREKSAFPPHVLRALKDVFIQQKIVRLAMQILIVNTSPLGREVLREATYHEAMEHFAEQLKEEPAHFSRAVLLECIQREQSDKYLSKLLVALGKHKNPDDAELLDGFVRKYPMYSNERYFALYALMEVKNLENLNLLLAEGVKRFSHAGLPDAARWVLALENVAIQLYNGDVKTHLSDIHYSLWPDLPKALRAAGADENADAFESLMKFLVPGDFAAAEESAVRAKLEAMTDDALSENCQINGYEAINDRHMIYERLNEFVELRARIEADKVAKGEKSAS